MEGLWLLDRWDWTKPPDGHTMGCDKALWAPGGHELGRGQEAGGRVCVGEGPEGGETNSQVGGYGMEGAG